MRSPSVRPLASGLVRGDTHKLIFLVDRSPPQCLPPLGRDAEEQRIDTFKTCLTS
jgi:hypothetical protein